MKGPDLSDLINFFAFTSKIFTSRQTDKPISFYFLHKRKAGDTIVAVAMFATTRTKEMLLEF